jgi:hypothetical protein
VSHLVLVEGRRLSGVEISMDDEGCGLMSRAHTSASSFALSNTVTEWPDSAHCIAAARPERPAPTIKISSLCDMFVVASTRVPNGTHRLASGSATSVSKVKLCGASKHRSSVCICTCARRSVSLVDRDCLSRSTESGVQKMRGNTSRLKDSGLGFKVETVVR